MSKERFLRQFEQSRKNIEAWLKWMREQTKMMAATLSFKDTPSLSKERELLKSLVSLKDQKDRLDKMYRSDDFRVRDLATIELHNVYSPTEEKIWAEVRKLLAE